MPVLTYIQSGKKINIQFEGKPKLSELLLENGLYIASPCGGRGVCKKCIVSLSGDVSQPDEKERLAGVRLACRTYLYGDCVAEPIIDESLAVVETETVCVKPPLNPDWEYGLAIDIGTTTVVAQLFKNDGACIATYSAINPQSAVSSDVMGRVSAALDGKSELLKKQIRDCISRLRKNVCDYAGISVSQIDKTVVTGNTAMLYLYSGRAPVSIAISPFKADCLFGEHIEDNVFLAPCADAFIGGDAVGSVLASGMCESGKTTLLCDIGTNGETVLYKNGKLFAVSASAGPAFEGGEITCGCGCVAGAIDRVKVDNGVIKAYTVDDASLVGFCGSGLISAVAAFLKQGYVDTSGYASNELILSVNGKSITLTQDDVRAFQLAKAAIRTSIDVLLSRTDTSIEDVDVFYISGGFGKHIDAEAAECVGLFPKGLSAKFIHLGNTSLSGAICMLFDKNNIAKARNIANNINVFNLSGEPDFYEKFIKNIDF